MILPTMKIQEDILGEFGFRLDWVISEGWADVVAYEMTGSEDGKPLFDRKNADHSGDFVDSIENAKPYLTGFVKFDGCSEFEISRVHWCGPVFYQKHFQLLEHIYKRAFELMECEPDEKWEP